MKIRPEWHGLAMLALAITSGCSFLGRSYAEAPWRIYSDEAKEAVRDQCFDVAEKNYVSALQELERKNDYAARVSYGLSQVYIKQGKYDKALAVRQKALKFVKNRQPGPGRDPNFGQRQLSDTFVQYTRLGECYLFQGRFGESETCYDRALELSDTYSRKYPINSGVNVSSVYPYVGVYYIHVADYEKARQYLQENLDMYIREAMFRADHAGRAKYRVALVSYYEGDDEAAEKLCRQAAGMSKGFAIFPEDLANNLTLLGRIEARRANGEKALQHFQSAREVLVGKGKFKNSRRVEQADVWNEIGRLHFMESDPEKATATHPNYADSVRGLAAIAAARDELTSAALLATESLDVLDNSLTPTHPRIAPALVALASIDRLTGKTDRIALLDERLETILQKPLGPWKEDVLETTAFYADRMKKAGLIA